MELFSGRKDGALFPPQLSFQQLSVFQHLKHLHLLDSYLVEFDESFWLWHTIVGLSVKAFVPASRKRESNSTPLNWGLFSFSQRPIYSMVFFIKTCNQSSSHPPPSLSLAAG